MNSNIDKLRNFNSPIAILKYIFANKANLNDDILIEALDLLQSDIYKKKIIKQCIREETKKAEALDKLSDEHAKADVITDFKNDKNKITELYKLKDERAKLRVMYTLRNEQDILDNFNILSNNENKIQLFPKFKNTDNQKKALKMLNPDLVRLQAILHSENVNNISTFSMLETQKMQQLANSDLFETLDDKELVYVAKAVILNDIDKLIDFMEDKLPQNNDFTIGIDPNITIGIEIESEGFMSEWFKKLKWFNGWQFVDDSSLMEDNDLEAKSPIIKDEPEDVKIIYGMCALLKKLGQKTSQRCGGHIHIGANYLKSIDAYKNLIEIWGNAEEIIFKICNEEGTILRPDVDFFARPITPFLTEAIKEGTICVENENNLNYFIHEIQEIQEKQGEKRTELERYFAINYLNINYDKNTIEFRVPNGTLDPNVWCENIKLFGRMVQRSQELAEILKNENRSEEDRQKLTQLVRIKEEMPEHKKLEVLLDILFVTEKEKNVYRRRYKSYCEKSQKIPDEQNPIKKMNFAGSIDFKRHSLDEFRTVTQGLRDEEVVSVTQETRAGMKEKVKKEIEGEYNGS